MIKEFLPYQPSLDMKELGFDEPCFAYYKDMKGEKVLLYDSMDFDGECSAPLYQQCFRFFREKYKLYHHITQYYGEHFYYKIEDMVHPRRYEEYPVEKLRNFGEYTSQEDAELACLIKLIEIVKDENKRL